MRFVESATWKVKVVVPVAVGVPLSVPPEVRENPEGNVPTTTDHEYGGVPPVACNVVCGYGMLTVPLGSEVVVTARGDPGCVMLTVKEWLPLSDGLEESRA